MGLSKHDGRGTARVSLARAPSSAAAARSFVNRELGGCVDHEGLDKVRLVASELVTNALKHGAGEIELILSRAADRVRVEVVDQGSGAAPKIRRRAGDESGGFGLRIVANVAQAWGSFEGTTHVWAEIVVGPDLGRRGR